MEQVNWNDAVQFCRKLSDLPEERAAHRAYRISTEAEWEYVYRAGTNSRWASTDNETRLDDFAWFKPNSIEQTHVVGQKKANQWGLHDMHGKVWEWCVDAYGPYPREALTDPTGLAQGPTRVVRGGGWDHAVRVCRSAYRSGHDPSKWSHALGFRLAMCKSSAQDPPPRVVDPGLRPLQPGGGFGNANVVNTGMNIGSTSSGAEGLGTGNQSTSLDAGTHKPQ